MKSARRGPVALPVQSCVEPAPAGDALALDLWLSRGADAVSSDAFKRRVLSRYVGLAPQALQFELGESGKPRLANVRTPCEFNISHSGGWILCGVTRGTTIGVDLEDTSRPRDVMRLARRFYSQLEIAELEAQSERTQRDHFYDLWTLKESAIKAHGEALAPGLKEFSFRFSGREHLDEATAASGAAEIAPLSARERAGTHYRLYDLPPDCRVAVCWHGLPGQAPRMRFLAESASDVPATQQCLLRAVTRSGAP